MLIPANTWIGLKNTGTEPNSLVAIFSAPGFEDYLRCRSVPAGEKVTSIAMDGIKDCAHEGHVVFEAFEKNPKNRPATINDLMLTELINSRMVGNSDTDLPLSFEFR